MSTSIAQKNIRLKRAYERPSPDDGVRILVDRLWPRGLKKVDAAIDHWMKDVAPSSELRRWFAHDPLRWKEFQRRYKQELKQRQKEINELRTLARHNSITLIFAELILSHDDRPQEEAAFAAACGAGQSPHGPVLGGPSCGQYGLESLSGV